MGIDAMRVTSNRQLWSALGGAVVGATIAAFFLTGQPKAEAQSDAKAAANTSVVYSAYYLNNVVATRKADRVREVIPFPETPIFFIRTDVAVAVYLRDGGLVTMMLEIPLDSKFEDLVFVGDRRTFIVKTTKSAKVFSIDRQVVTEVQKKK